VFEDSIFEAKAAKICPRRVLAFDASPLGPISGHQAWNNLPASPHELADSRPFKHQLKTFLFQQAYDALTCTFSCYLVLFYVYFRVSQLLIHSLV